MARCGRCGMWADYPEDHPEKKWAGVCLWFQMRLPEEEVWEHRECAEFFERVPGVDPLRHFDFKVKRDQIGAAWKAARRAEKLAWFSIVMTLFGFFSGC